ncbi:hypothetical protein NQ318_005733 [Aromia moschata]|uniref:Uncharacterized protein n=1 Tax=Aromia moschata TaxID=1265417 RepID=A0AAV8YR56_9CUCU|nr:hypothetical protein NQ318_005733 [Aromia moschata]
MNHLQSKHGLNLKEPQIDKHKEQIVNMNHSSYISDMKSEPFGYQSSQGPNKDHNATTAATINSVNNTVIKLEPRDEPMELTNQSRGRAARPAAPLNIPQVIPMSQQIPPSMRQPENHYDEEKRMEKHERGERPDRPERVDRPDRQDVGPMVSTPIGQPPLPSLMQSGNLVTIGGPQPSQMSHYGFMSPFSHPQSPRNLDKAQQHVQQQHGGHGQNQSEPQNLKIKQEVPDMSGQSQSLPPNHLSGLNTFTQNALPPGPGPTSHTIAGISQSLTTNSIATAGGFVAPSSLQPPIIDPLQSLKDVQGYLPPPQASSSQSSSSDRSDRPSSGPVVDNIKKEPEFGRPASSGPSPKLLSEKCTTPKNAASTPTPRHQFSPFGDKPDKPQLRPPTSLQQPHAHQPHGPSYGSMHPPHHLVHPSFLHMQFPGHPYSGYPFSYPYPYPVPPQPHPIPPTSRPDMAPKSIDTVSATLMSSQHSTSSTLTSKRETRESDENGSERHQTHEMTLTNHQSTSHNSSVHATVEKHNYGGSHSITISHSTSTSSSQSVQHKVNQKTVRTSSPHTPVSQTSSTASINHTSSSSTSNHQHTHHHTHTHHDRLSPGNQLLRHSMHGKPPAPQTNPHHLMIQPPNMGQHPSSLGPPSLGSSSLDALRAHAAQAAANMQQQQQGSMHPPSTSPMNAAPPKVVSDEVIKVEPDPEPTPPEDDSQSSPVAPSRGALPGTEDRGQRVPPGQSAIFLRHWNRGDYNSCTRTDLTFKPVPDSKLARKREERLRKQAEREREERERAQQAQQRKITTPEKPDVKPPSRGPPGDGHVAVRAVPQAGIQRHAGPEAAVGVRQASRRLQSR